MIPADAEMFTPSESAIVAALHDGIGDAKEIAGRTGMTASSVRTHMTTLSRKIARVTGAKVGRGVSMVDLVKTGGKVWRPYTFSLQITVTAPSEAVAREYATSRLRNRRTNLELVELKAAEAAA